MKKILLALSVTLCGTQLVAQIPVYWTTTTPSSFTISGSTIRNTAWASGLNYANSTQRLKPGQDGYVEFSAENPVTASVAYQVGFAKASAPGTPIVSFYVMTFDANNIYPSRFYNSATTGYSGSCLLVSNLSVLRMERTGNTVRFWNKTANCELIYSPAVSLSPAPAEDWVVVFKPTGDGVISGAVNTKVSFSNAEDLWGRITPTKISTVSLLDSVGIGKAPEAKLDVEGTTRISTLAGTGNALVEAASNGLLQRKTMGLATQALLGNGTWGDVSGFGQWKAAASPAGAIYFQPASGARYVGINQATPAANLDIANSGCDNKPALRIMSDENWLCSFPDTHGDYVDIGANTVSGFAQRFIIKANGFVGINRAPSYHLDAAGSIRVVSTIYPSDKRFKDHIQAIDQPLELIRQLSGKSYTFKTKEFPAWNFNEGIQYGFIAQELKKVMPELVKEDQEGYFGVNYTMLIPVLTEAVKAQQNEIETLKQELAALKDGRTQQTTAVDEVTMAGAYLAQNVPNPFSRTTSISYKLPAGINTATLGIYDLNGKEIRLFKLGNAATGSVTISGGDLKPGMYVYTLIIDGKYFDSRKMILTSE